MRVGYFSPLPPERSGVADYSALLLPALARHLDVEIVSPRRRFRRRPAFDLALYHIGNSPEAHGWILDELRARRGLVVLHEFSLHHLVAGVTVGRGDSAGYLDAMQREAGTVGRLLAHGVIDGLVPPLWERRAGDFPLAGEVLDHADGVIVHSRHAVRLTRDAQYTGPVWRIPMPAWPQPSSTPYTLDRPRAPLILCFGNLNPAKRVPQLLEAFARLRGEFPEALLVLAGGVSGIDLDREIDDARARDAVLALGRVEEGELWSLLAACDLCVSLRWPTMGETSAVVVRALAAARPVVVSDVGSFAELPDDVAIKIPVDEREVDALTDALRRLASNADERRQRGAAAGELARSEHGLERVADLYAAACEESMGLRLAEDAMLTQVAVAAADVGMTGDAPAVRDIGAAARELVRGE